MVSLFQNDLHALLERHHLPAPVYTPLSPKGPTHLRTFTIKLEIHHGQGEGQQRLWVGHGEGKSKKEAEGSAAHDALDYMEQALKNQTLFLNAKPKARISI